MKTFDPLSFHGDRTKKTKGQAQPNQMINWGKSISNMVGGFDIWHLIDHLQPGADNRGKISRLHFSSFDLKFWDPWYLKIFLKRFQKSNTLFHSLHSFPKFYTISKDMTFHLLVGNLENPLKFNTPLKSCLWHSDIICSCKRFHSL